MTNQEATERMALSMVEKLPPLEKKRLFRCKNDLEKVLRDYGPLGLLALGILSTEIQGGRKPGQLKVEPTQAMGTPVVRECVTGIPILQQHLWGQPWNKIAMGYVHGLRPSAVVIAPKDSLPSTTEMPWRVTVFLDENKNIHSIFQEVSVALPEGCESGNELWEWLMLQKQGEKDAKLEE